MPIHNPAVGVGKSIATGTYTGDGNDDRQITTGFKCSFVIIQGRTGGNDPFRWTVIPNHSIVDDAGTDNRVATAALLHATDGFVVDKLDANVNLEPYYYWAISE